MKKLFNKNVESSKPSVLDEDVNAKNFQGRTSLFYADSVDVAKQLIEAGADVNARDKFNRSPLHMIDDVDIARLLIDKGSNVNAVDGNNSTTLHYAACKGDVAMAQLLISKGADVYIKDNKGQTALDEALNYEYRDIAEAINAKKLKAAGKRIKPEVSFRKF